MDTAISEPIGIQQDVRQQIVERGFAWIPAAAWHLTPEMESHWKRLANDWDHLEQDRFLKPGATFRRRRYGRYYWSPARGELTALPNQSYFQPPDQNGYAGGVEREFAQLLPETVRNRFLHALIRLTFACLPTAPERRERSWEVRVHQIRIVASPEEPGEPAPEGIHQDGTDFLTLHLVRRSNVSGAVSTIYDLDRRPIQTYTMLEPLDSFVLEDPRILHGVTAVHPADGKGLAIRDLLGIDFIFAPELTRPDSGL